MQTPLRSLAHNAVEDEEMRTPVDRIIPLHQSDSESSSTPSTKTTSDRPRRGCFRDEVRRAIQELRAYRSVQTTSEHSTGSSQPIQAQSEESSPTRPISPVSYRKKQRLNPSYDIRQESTSIGESQPNNIEGSFKLNTDTPSSFKMGTRKPNKRQALRRVRVAAHGTVSTQVQTEPAGNSMAQRIKNTFHSQKTRKILPDCVFLIFCIWLISTANVEDGGEEQGAGRPRDTCPILAEAFKGFDRCHDWIDQSWAVLEPRKEVEQNQEDLPATELIPEPEESCLMVITRPSALDVLGWVEWFAGWATLVFLLWYRIAG